MARPSVFIHLAPFLTEMLGFEDSTFYNPGTFTLDRMGNMNPINTIYVYCDVIENWIVGHSVAPLVDMLACKVKK